MAGKRAHLSKHEGGKPSRKREKSKEQACCQRREARLWWVLQRLSVMAIDFEKEGTSPDRTWQWQCQWWSRAQRNKPSNVTRKITTCKKKINSYENGILTWFSV